VKIRHGDMEAEVDEELADLILEMWKAGIFTIMSCQEGPESFGGRAWVQMPAESAEAFLDIVAPFDPEDDFYNRVTGMWEPDDWETFRREHAWQYRAEPMNLGVDEKELEDGSVEEFAVGPTSFEILVQIAFPPADIPELVRRLRAR
jgi:hypothetical protein